MVSDEKGHRFDVLGHYSTGSLWADNDPNDCMNHPKWLGGSCETCLRHILNYSTAENYFFRSNFRNFSTEND